MSADLPLSGAGARFADLIATCHIVAIGIEAPLAVSPRLRACARCGAAFLPRRMQACCSRPCAMLHRPARPASPRRRAAALRTNPVILRLLDIQPLERGARGGWRFGTRRISDRVVANLIASGRAEIRGEQLFACHQPDDAT